MSSLEIANKVICAQLSQMIRVVTTLQNGRGDSAYDSPDIVTVALSLIQDYTFTTVNDDDLYDTTFFKSDNYDEQYETEDYDGRGCETNSKIAARSDAYAMYTLGFSEDYYSDLFDNIVEATMETTGKQSLIRKSFSNSAVRARKKEAGEYVSEWERG